MTDRKKNGFSIHRFLCSKRTLAAVALTCITLFVLLVFIEKTSNGRWIAHRSLTFIYLSIESNSDNPKIHFGATPVSIDPNIALQTLIQKQIIELYSVANLDVTVDISTYEQIDISPQFQHQKTDHHQVQEFKASLSSILEQSDTVFDLSQNIRSLAPHRDDQFAGMGNPVEIYKNAKQGKGLTCRPFSILFSTALVAEGYTSRMLSLSKDGKYFHHAVTEVYVPEFQKWILIDPDFNIAYRKNGQWLNAAEIQRVWIDLKKSYAKDQNIYNQLKKDKDALSSMLDIELVVLGDAGEPLRNTNLAKGSCTSLNLELFEYIFYPIRNDLITGDYPFGHPIRTSQYVITDDQNNSYTPICPEAYPVENLDSVYWPVGQTIATVADTTPSEPSTIMLGLATWTPNFSHFEVCIDNGSWNRLDQSQLAWKLHTDSNSMEVRSVNQAGLSGEIFKISVEIPNAPELNNKVSLKNSLLDTVDYHQAA